MSNFYEALNKSGEEVNLNRIDSIFEETKTCYQRQIENIELSIRKLKIEQEEAMDLSSNDPGNSIKSKDFNAEGFVHNDTVIMVKIENLKFTLDAALKRQKHLFGNGEE